LAALEPGAPEGPDFDMPIAPRERAVALLHLGSEIEHALMVQYLYAAYSLNAAQPVAEHRRQVARWREVIAEIAREEMGHLASVQNLLTLIGGPLCFEREDYPIIDPDLWPFPFDLEPLSKDSLTSYVTLAGFLADDQLYVDTSKTTCNAYLGLEFSFVTGIPVSSCGGRAPSYDVIDYSYSMLSMGLAGFNQSTLAPLVHDDPQACRATPTDPACANHPPTGTTDTTFPFLAAPH
jgi:hypothetical protein